MGGGRDREGGSIRQDGAVCGGWRGRGGERHKTVAPAGVQISLAGETDTLSMGHSIVCVKCNLSEPEGPDTPTPSTAKVATLIHSKVLPKIIITFRRMSGS